MKKAIFVLGLKWFDKVNGNTYCRPVVILDDGSMLTTRYEYGYGRYYMTMAENLCKEHGVAIEYPATTEKYVKKSELKDERYY